jgi:protease-4
MSSQNTPGPSTGATDSDRTVVLVLAVVAAVIAGVFVVAALSGAGITGSDSSADGTVAVVSIEGPIVQPIGAQLEDELNEIRANDSIDAVVLEMNTPGGAPAPTERMYLSIQRTSEQMPLHASVQGLSASAGYYMMMPAEKIYVLPTSQVGSVGLAAGEPQAIPPVEGPSGPDKRGSNVINDLATQETIANIFLETVIEQRGDRIELSREEISTARVFTGVDSVENGFADEIGSLDDAVEDAATEAGLDDYRTVEREVSAVDGLPFFAQTEHGVVAIYDENPSLADVKPIDNAMVYEPAIPHVDELEAVSESDVPEPDDESGGEQP